MTLSLRGEIIPNAEQLPALVLAYVGDAAYELAIRQYLVTRGLVSVNQLHREAIKYVRADAQARVMRALKDELTEVEAAVARRGRNARSGHPPRGSDVISYRYSTGLESLIGYLYLSGQNERLEEIVSLARQVVEKGD
ncbi:Mini-ribonuclease 3 [Desulfofundulus sp.]|uniref:Mini-ribonuclease 3 n=1 Tax=Desulfofundulus sp. TaxID=2282750 RepID=UPI003C722EDA